MYYVLPIFLIILILGILFSVIGFAESKNTGMIVMGMTFLFLFYTCLASKLIYKRITIKNYQELGWKYNEEKNILTLLGTENIRQVRGGEIIVIQGDGLISTKGE